MNIRRLAYSMIVAGALLCCQQAHGAYVGYHGGGEVNVKNTLASSFLIGLGAGAGGTIGHAIGKAVVNGAAWLFRGAKRAMTRNKNETKEPASTSKTSNGAAASAA